MLIPPEDVINILKQYKKQIFGVLHIGAHDCEEKEFYNSNGIPDEQVYWIEAITEKCRANKAKGIPNVYEATIFHEETNVNFFISKDTLSQDSKQSSSILPFHSHLQWYPHIGVDHVEQKQTITLKKWIEEYSIPIQKLNFWNLDIQGVELHALLSADSYIQYADIIYTEVNIEQVYQNVPLLPYMDTFLAEKGFERVALKLAVQGWGDAIYIRK